LAIILAAIVVQAGDQGQVAGRAVDRLQPVDRAAVELAVERYYAAAFARGDSAWNRQVLNHTPTPRIGIYLQRRIADVALVIHPQLLVIDAFARVVRQRVNAHRARVRFVRFPRLPQRVLSAVLFQAAVDQRQFAVVIGLDIKLGKGLVPACAAVVAVAVGVHARGVEHKTCAVGRAFGAQVVFVQAVAADQGFGADTWRAFAVAGEHLDHAAGVAAVQGGGRSAQHFDAFGGVEVECGRLALAIRGAGGDAVGDQLDAAYAKGRPGAKAA